ncbi:MAG TPA: hypothetical protein VNW90_13465 [Acetobacteraceae bacterium]|nr:hypothetical protein [Acetobacteraceae bacterium]
MGDRMAELNILLAGFVPETHGKMGENAMTDVIGPVAPIGFASAMLGEASPTGARTITRPGSSSSRHPNCGP